MSKVAILGCGPSGLVAAHAVLMSDFRHDVALFSRKIKSQVYGAQYLHQPIPGIMNHVPKVIRYILDGEPQAYLRKVYGDAWDGTINDEMRTQAFVAWDLRATYDRLWETYQDLVFDTEINGALLEEMPREFDLIINTIPRPALCKRPTEHRFKSTTIWASGDTEMGGCPVRGEEAVIRYNGNPEPSWYRSARLFGYSTVEWPGWMDRPPYGHAVKVKKPLAHTCDCWTRSMVHMGRMGRWQNGYLVHQVYADVAEQLIIARAGVKA